MTRLLEINHLKKVYKDVVAVADVTFDVNTGVCFGLLGPNGAGKTTTIEIIEDIIPATAGTIRYKGAERSGSFREEIGIQFQHTSLLNFLSVQETLLTFRKLFTHTVDIANLVKRCELEQLLQRRNDKLSGGQKQRLMLALALINDPELIFLDEPSTGLDPQSRRNLWAIVEQIKAEGKTIIITTHSMEEAQYLCDEIAIMDNGQIIARDTPENLISTYCRTSTITLPYHSFGNNTDSATLKQLSIEKHDDQAVISTDSVDHTLHILSENNIALDGLNIRTPNLEDVFLHLTGKRLRD